VNAPRHGVEKPVKIRWSGGGQLRRLGH